MKRQCELAGKQVEAQLERQSSWALGAQRVYRWTGTVKHGAQSFNVLDAYVGETVAGAKFSGGRKGGWVIADFHRTVLKPAVHALTAAGGAGGAAGGEGGAAGGGTLVETGGARVETSWLNYTTLTYTSEVCLSVTTREDAPGALPRARFELMRHMCH